MNWHPDDLSELIRDPWDLWEEELRVYLEVMKEHPEPVPEPPQSEIVDLSWDW